MRSGGRRGAGERVLESKHVIGLFLLMLVFSGVFFTLGYVMGRNQYEGQVRAEAAMNPRPKPQPAAPSKPDSSSKRTKSGPSESAPPSDVTSPPDSEWSFYNHSKDTAPDETLKPAAAVVPSRTPGATAKSRNSKSQSAWPNSTGGYFLQVSATRRASDALALASHLKKKNFPASVSAPGADKYYRVQVGPYPDQKSAEAARKALLDGVGFKAIVKH
jgi:septal ring-binding cell division protein DamX